MCAVFGFSCMAGCLNCAARLARNHRFCPQCGASQGSGEPGADARQPDPDAGRKPSAGVARVAAHAARLKMRPERKQVSVLFADLCDSTAHVQHTDPEEARAYLNDALRLMTDAVEAYGGTVSQLLGDGLLALFGAPVAQEDHALRACLAASAMQTSARNRKGSGPEASFELRVGIHSGEVIVGVSGQYLLSHYRADGTTIHLASRLEKLAPTGAVVLSAATQRLIAEQLDTRSLGTRCIRGMDTPMELFELVLGSEGSAAAPLARRQRWAPMVGRDETLQMLDALAGSARGGAMRVVGLRGEAGIGKSRLIAEWCTASALGGFMVCTTHARGYASANAYGVIADLARALVNHPQWNAGDMQQSIEGCESGAADGERGRHLEAINDLLEVADADQAWLTLSPTVRRRRIADALHWLVSRRLQRGPLLLVLEDIFLADRESQRLLESLVPRLEGKPVLICVSYRQDFEHRWADSAWFVEHWIAPLRGPDMGTLAHAMLGDHDSVRGVVDELVERADGNPFFLEQLAINLIDDGSLVGTPGAYWLTRPQAELRPPASIAAVICARVDRLPAAAKAALEAAAVLGDPLTSQLIAAMHEVEPAQADHLLRLGVASGLLTAPRSPSADATTSPFAFRHALVQEVVLGTLTRLRRKGLHRQAFLALQAHHGTGNAEASPTLTRHAFIGEQWEHAATYAVKSIARAVTRSANREALRLFELGVDASRRVASQPLALSLELGLLLEAIGALMALGHIDAIFANLERAHVIAGELGDQRCRATVALQTSVFLWMRGRYTPGLVSANHALDAGRKAGRRNLQMAASQTRLMLLHGLGRYREAVEEARAALRDFEPELRGHRLLAGWATVPIINLLTFYANSLSRLGNYEAAQEACDQAYTVLSEFDHPYSRGLLDFTQGHMWIELGRCAQAETLMRSCVELCAVRDIPTLMPCAVAILGGALAGGGQAKEAASRLEKAIHERIYLAGGVYGEFFIRLYLGVALRRLGRWAEAITAGEQALELAVAGEQHGHRTDALFELGETLRDAGQPERAHECFVQSLAQARRCELPLYMERAARSAEALEVAIRP